MVVLASFYGGVLVGFHVGVSVCGLPCGSGHGLPYESVGGLPCGSVHGLPYESVGGLLCGSVHGFPYESVGGLLCGSGHGLPCESVGGLPCGSICGLLCGRESSMWECSCALWGSVGFHVEVFMGFYVYNDNFIHSCYINTMCSMFLI